MRTTDRWTGGSTGGPTGRRRDGLFKRCDDASKNSFEDLVTRKIIHPGMDLESSMTYHVTQNPTKNEECGRLFLLDANHST